MEPASRGTSPAVRLGIDSGASTDSTLDAAVAGARRAASAAASLPETAREAAVDTYEDWEFQHSQAELAVDEYIDRDKTVAHNIVGAAVTLGLSVIMLILMAIVAGYFVSEAPSNGAFSDAINQVESVGGTAFILLAVALLAVPVVAIVGYFMRSGLGGFITGGGMGR
jgi:hypothetical protein